MLFRSMSVIGASVLEKGVQGNGTITDIDGIFKLSVSSSKAQLDISYIGYQSQTVAVQVGKNLKIILQEDSKQLEEVVVVGYGTQSKKTLTGAVSKNKYMKTLMMIRRMKEVLTCVRIDVSGKKPCR